MEHQKGEFVFTDSPFYIPKNEIIKPQIYLRIKENIPILKFLFNYKNTSTLFI